MNKRFLIIGVWIIILCVISAIGVFLFIEIKQGKDEGMAYAKTHDRQACVNQVMTGKRVCTEVSCFLKSRYFYQACMDNAKPSVTLCQSVPPINNLFQFEAWKNKQCKKTKRTDRSCHHIWQKVRNMCKKES